MRGVRERTHKCRGAATRGRHPGGGRGGPKLAGARKRAVQRFRSVRKMVRAYLCVEATNEVDIVRRDLRLAYLAETMTRICSITYFPADYLGQLRPMYIRHCCNMSFAFDGADRSLPPLRSLKSTFVEAGFNQVPRVGPNNAGGTPR